MKFSPIGWGRKGRSMRSRPQGPRRRHRPRDRAPQLPQAGERLEQRQMLAFDFVAAFSSDFEPFYISGVTAGTQVLQESPQQMTLRFSPGVTIDSSSLDAISMTRLDGGLVKLGSITVNDAPNQNEVILRFAEALPDATYRIDIGAGLASTSTAVGTVNAATFDVRVELGAHVVSVVPQPVSRTGAVLSQAKDQIVVYFNANDPLDSVSAESVANYLLIELDAAGNDTATTLAPSRVNYDATTGRALLSFASDLSINKLFRLQVGRNGTAIAGAVNVNEKVGGTDDNSSFVSARDLGLLGTAGATVEGALDVRLTLPTPAGSLPFSSQPGAIDEPGHRDISVNLDPPDADGVQIINTGENHGRVNAGTGMAGPVHVQAYNFKSFYGFGAQRQQLYNAISEAQKQRAREIFELYSRYTGIRFVETVSDGITVVTGDMRAIDPDILTTPDGLTGTPIDVSGGRVFGVTAIMDATNNWGSSEFGGAWFREAMEQIGHALGLSNSFDIPSIMGVGLPGEPVFPGDYDILHAEMLYPNSGTDIDIYRFELPTAGQLVAETFVARPGQPILSKADTVLTLYRQDANGSREMIARNDDSFGTDSFVELDLDRGVYFVAITSTGNTDFNPEIENSGAHGRSDGAYELRLNFTPDATAAGTIVDDNGTLFDGDRDGVAGGVFNFWFRTGDTVYVDKAAATAGADGSLAYPYPTIDAAIRNVGSRSIIRIVGNDLQIPYEIGRNASNVVLEDGATLNVPRNVTVMIDEGAVFKLSRANIDVGTSAAAAPRVGAALQVLGTPTNRVTFTSYHDDTIGGDTDGFGPATQGGQWGGIVLRQDSDVAGGRAFLNTIANANVRYGGGQVLVDSRLQTFTPIHLETTRPTIVFNQITNSAGAAISADPNSFEDDGQRVGPEIRGNVLEKVKPVLGVGARVTAVGTVGGNDQRQFRIGEPVARVGAALFIDGNDTGLVVASIDPSGMIALSGDLPQSLSVGDTVGFAFAGNTAVSTSRIFVADLSGIVVGGVVSGVPGVPPGTKVVSVTSQTAGVIVEFDQRVKVVSGTPIGFGSNSVNGLFIRIKTNAGSPIDRLDVPARFKSTDITYVLAENLIVSGGAGGYVDVAIATQRANLVAGSGSFTLPVGSVAANGLTVGMRVTGPGVADGTAVATIAGDVITVTQPLTRSQSQASVTFYQEQARQSGRLTIDPGVIVKLDRSRIELERGVSQLFAEGTAGRRVIFTSLADNRFGAGGTFDTNGNQPDKFDQFGRSIDVDGALLLSPTLGDWAGIILNAGAKASIDQAYIAFGGGTTSIEGGFDQFNVIEVHQGDLRLANSRIERNAEGLATTDRTGRQGNDSATIFVRGAQPVIIRNDFRDNAGAMISINANSLDDSFVPDPGRGTGAIERYRDYDANFGPLVRDNRISYGLNTPVTTPPAAPARMQSSTGAETPVSTVTEMQWNGRTSSVVKNSWVFRASDSSFTLDAGWQARSLGGGFYSMTAPGSGVENVLAWAASQTSVKVIEPDFVFQRSATYPDDPDFGQLWGLENTGQSGGVVDADIDAPEAWDVTVGSSSVVVAVLDSGVDYTHPDLATNIWVNGGEIPGDGIDNDDNGFVDDVRGWDFAYDDADPMDVDGHGTHVAGTIAAVGNNGVGMVGVSWNSSILPVKVLGDDGTGSLSDVIDAINYITALRQAGVNVVAINASLGSYGFSQVEADAVAAAGQTGIIFVAAAGNDANNNDGPFSLYPASHADDLIISVAATDRSNRLASFSNYGVTSVDISAPGVAIYSTLPGGTYGFQQGTSMAAPHVAGAVAILASAFPNARASEIRDAILDSAVPSASLANRVATGGLLNVAAALDMLRGRTGISGMVVRGEEITVESVWDDTDIVHVLRSEIVVNNFHTKTGLRLLSQSDASLVVKLQGTTAGFTATGTALDIDDRIGGTVQLVGQPGYPVVLTSLADDTVGVSLDALGRVVRDTNGDGSASTPAPGDWRSLRFEPLSNDRNVAILVEREAGVTGGIDANGTTDEAQVLGTLAPNYATTNDQGTLNSWESAQEKSGDESLRQGFEVHGSIAFDDPTDVDVYTFTGYAGSEVWIDVDNTSPSLDAMVELLDASGTVIARSADSLIDTGVVTSTNPEVVQEGSSSAAMVAGTQTIVVGVAAGIDGIGAQVQGFETAVTAVAAAADGVGVLVQGFETVVTGVAAAPDGVGGQIAGFQTSVIGTAAAVVGQSIGVVAAAGVVAAIAGQQVTITNGGFIQDQSGGGPGSAVYVNNTPAGVRVVVNAGGVLSLSGPLTGVAVGDTLGFSIEGALPITVRRVLVAAADFLNTPIASQVSSTSGVSAGTSVVNRGTAANPWIEFNQDITVSASQPLLFGPAGTNVFVIDDVGAVAANATVSGTGLPGTIRVTSVDPDTSRITLSANVNLAPGALLTFNIASGSRTASRVVVASATGAADGVPVTGSGITAGDGITVTGAAVGNVVTLSAARTVTNNQSLAFGFNDTTFTVDLGTGTGLASGAAVFRNGVQVGTVASSTATSVTLNAAVPVANDEFVTFGFHTSPSITTRVIRVDDIAAVRQGATVTSAGFSGSRTVTSIDIPTSTVVLSADIPAASGMLLEFDFAGGGALTASRVVVASATGAADGVPVTGSGITAGDGITVTGAAVGNVITLSAARTIFNNQLFAFGFNGNVIRVVDVTGIELGTIVAGTGVGTIPVVQVTGSDPDNQTLTLSSSVQVADGGTLFFGSRTFQLAPAALPSGALQSVIPGTVQGVVYLDNTAIQTFTVARDSTFTFMPIGDPVARVIDDLATIDYTTGTIRLPFDVVPTGTIRLEVSYEYGRLTRETLGFSATGEGGAMTLAKDDYRGVDMYSTNPRNPGMRVVLPGVTGTDTQYFVRVRSQSAYDAATTPNAYAGALANPIGASSGHYELRIRERQQDEKPGSTVRYADLRFPTVGIDVIGLPRNSQLVGETGEVAAANDAFGQAQQLGNLLATDRNTISVAGTTTNDSDIDWYTFTVDFTDIDVISRVNDADKTWATIFDIDYADGFKGDLTLSVFDQFGQLIYVGRDSNIADDQPADGQGNDFDDLSRGSVGVLDPYIGSVQLPAGAPGSVTRYYVAVSSNERLPAVLNATFQANAANPLIRLEPVSSVRRIVEDHIGNTGYFSNDELIAPVTGPIIDVSSAIALETHIRPFTLDDLTVFVATDLGLRAINPFTGRADQVPLSYSENWLNVAEGDLDFLTNGTIVLYGREADGVGTVWNVDPATGARSTRWTDGIVDDAGGAPPPDSNAVNITNATVDAVVIGRSDVAQYNAVSTGASGSATFYSMRDNFQLPGTRSVIYAADSNGSAATTIVANNAPLSVNQFGRMGFVPSGIDLSLSDSATNYVAGTNNRGGDGSGTVITGFTTGLQFRNENRNASGLYAVSSGGQFFRIQPRNPNARTGATAGPENVTGNLHDPLTIHDARDFSSLLNARFGTSQWSLQGLATAPVNLEGGRYQGMFMAITDGGGVFLIDPDGAGPGNAAVVDNVFDTNGDGIGDSWISNEALAGVRGLAVAPLDINLWHPTEQRWSDPGHGIDFVPDNSREFVPIAGTSMYFGLDGWGEGADFWSYGGSGQFGTASYNAYNWQQELTAGLGANNYNLPGGARGSMVTKPFSLAGYEYADKPTLYFNYFLETDGTNDELFDLDVMRDSARVFASRDGGLTWELLATNNSIRSSLEPFAPRAELSPSGSASSRIGNPETSSQPTQQVQELFDNTGGWRQARIDIGEFAGESNIQLRFDFSTGGDFNRTSSNDNAMATPSAIRRVTVDAAATSIAREFEVGVESPEGIQIGMRVQRWWEGSQQFIDPTADPSDPAAGVIRAASEATAEVVGISVDPLTSVTVITVRVSANASSSFVVGESLAFFPNRAGVDTNNILGAAAVIGGDSNVATRSTDNAHEGFYIDDIIVGFAERGEMVTSSISNQAFFDIGTPTGTSEYPEQVLEGEYQLEIRRGAEFAEIISSTTPRSPFVEIRRVFDTNDRLVPAPAVPEIVLEQNDLSAIGGNVARLGNGVITPAAGALQMAGNGGNFTAFNAITWSVDLAGQSSAFLEVEYSTGWQSWPRASEPLTPLPLRFTLGDDLTTGAVENNQLPAGDGIAVSVDGGNQWVSVFDFTGTSDRADVFRTGRVDLVTALNRAIGQPVGQNSHLTATTVIGFFQSGTLTAAESGGVAIRNAIITAAPRTQNVGLVGDSNLPRQQGRFLIENNFIVEASLYGVRIDAGRDNSIASLQPGVARNLPTLNYGRLAPGVVVTNNVIAASGTAGILFSGDSNSGGNVAPLATVPYGRIVNNTIYGVLDAQNAPQGVGVSVEQSAAPTLLNNLFANLASGILVDGSSIADGLGNSRTVVGYSGFYNVTNEVSAAVTANNSISLPTDPFVAADRGNFYLAPQSRAIDSAIDTLQDRNEFVVVNNQIGIPESPILAPARDIYGQLRSDDPSVAWTGSGLGFNVFKDRGAIDRVDFTQPTIQIAVPLDNSSDDRESARNIVKLVSQAARGQLQFVLQMDDIGAGIDKTTVATEAFEMWYSSYPGAPAQQLADGVDYFFRYLETRNQVVFDSAVVFPLGTYEFRVTSHRGDDTQLPLLIDLAGNTVLPNAAGGVISFTVSLVDVPAVPSFVRAVADEGQVSLEWISFANGAEITAYELQQSQNGGSWDPVTLPSVAASQIVRTGLIDGDFYRFRVRATNERGTGEWAEVGPLTPLKVPNVALREDTGVAWDASTFSDHVTRNELVDVTEILPGATWEYSLDAGSSWTGATTSFSLSEGSYAPGMIQVRQTLVSVTSSVGQNTEAWTIDRTGPNAPVVLSLIDDSGFVRGPVQNGGLTDDPSPTFRGTAEPGSTLRIRWLGGAEERTVDVGESGQWEAELDLEDGLQQFSFVAIDVAGNESPEATFSVTVDTEGPRVVITSLMDDQDPIRGTIVRDGLTNDRTPAVVGTAPPNSVVTLKATQGGVTRTVATVVSNPIGAWTATTASLGDGVIDLRAEVTDSVGRTGESATYRITLDTTAPDVPVIIHAVDDVGPETGNLTSGDTTDDFTPTLQGAADSGSTINMVITLPTGQRVISPTTSSAGDNGWSWTPNTPFGTLGTHVFRAIATDAAGNTSPVSSEFRLVLSGDPPPPPPPEQPVITALIDNYPDSTSDVVVPRNGRTDDSTPMINGTAVPGQYLTVVALQAGRERRTWTSRATQNGVWSVPTSGTPLANGTYTFRAISETGQSTDYTVTIDAPTSTQPITATAEWGPMAPANGVIHLDFTEPVTGTALRAITLEYRGRKVSLRDHTVATTDNQRYVITLPSRVRRETGEYAIILMYEQIRSMADPTKTMDGQNSRIIIANPPPADPGMA